MNEKIKAAWVAALRSGQYKKGTGRLRDEQNRFCCLGVLCNLHAQAHPQIAVAQKSSGCYMGCEAVLPRAVSRWAGLGDHQDPDVLFPLRKKNKRATLSFLNDGNHVDFAPRTFNEIADLIEAQL